MNQLISGVTMIILGTILIVFYNRQSKKQPENSLFEKPYLKNGGMGFILFGIYYLLRFVLE
jgi:hypothetical protein